MFSSAEKKFTNLDFRNVDLSGISVSSISLVNSQFDGANLIGANFQQVRLVNTSFKGANLSRARFELVDASSTSLVGIEAEESRWELVNLTNADFSKANLANSVIRTSNLEKAIFEKADLSHGMITYCNARDANFCGTCFAWTNTIGSTFSRANLVTAREFFLCREIVTEILKREINEIFEIAKLVGSIQTYPKWCYPEWKDLLDQYPEYLAIAYKIFQKYPDSGCLEALQNGWRPPRNSISATTM